MKKIEQEEQEIEPEPTEEQLEEMDLAERYSKIKEKEDEEFAEKWYSEHQNMFEEEDLVNINIDEEVVDIKEKEIKEQRKINYEKIENHSRLNKLYSLWMEYVNSRCVGNDWMKLPMFHVVLGQLIKGRYIDGGRKRSLRNHLFTIQTSRCLSRYTNIQTDKGNTQLNKLSEQFNVISYNFDKKKKEIVKAKKIESGKKQLYKIKLKGNRSVRASENHIFFIKDGNGIIEKKLKDIKVGDLILTDDEYRGKIPWNKGKKCPKISKNAIERWNNLIWKEKELYNRMINLKENYKKRGKKISKSLKGHKRAKESIEKERKTKQQLRKEGKLFAWNKGLTKETDERVRKISESIKKSGKCKGKNNPSYGKIRYPARIYVDELGYKVKSSWEKECAIELLKNKISFKYENICFQLKNTTYTPDFEIIPKKLYLEVKGPIFDKQLQKYKEFLKLNPNLKLIFLTKYEENDNKLKKEGFECYIMNNKKWIEVIKNEIL